MSMVHLSNLPSRTPFHPLRATERTDPYWASLWRSGSTGEWFSRADFDRLTAAGLATAPKWLQMSAEDAHERVYAPRNREKVLRIIAALDQWRTMTVQQVEALTNVAGIAKGNASLVSALWNSGLLDVCIVGSSLGASDLERTAVILRPARMTTKVQRFQESLTYPEWVSVTGGLGLDADRQFTRHNVLATEFGLRLSEYSNVATVLGEKLSSTALLAYAGVGMAVPTTGVNGGSDLTLVRTDGLRIAVEVTANRGGGWFYEKVERLVQTMHRRPLAETGMCVLFLVAPHQDATPAEANDVLRKAKRAIQKAVRSYPGKALDPTAARIGVALWTDLFPAAHHTTPDLRTLPVERPTGPGFLGDPNDERVWETAHFLDANDVPFAPEDGFDALAVARTASGLRGVPHALHQPGSRAQMSDLSVREMGFHTLPQVVGTVPVGAPPGGSRARKLPPRLQF